MLNHDWKDPDPPLPTIKVPPKKKVVRKRASMHTLSPSSPCSPAPTVTAAGFAGGMRKLQPNEDTQTLTKKNEMLMKEIEVL